MTSEPAARAALSIACAPGEGEKRKLTIGREPPCTVVIRDDTVSAKHCELALGDASVMLRDLASTNGCVVNGREVPKNGAAKVRLGDTIELGDAQFVLERAEAEESESEDEEEEEQRPLIATGAYALWISWRAFARLTGALHPNRRPGCGGRARGEADRRRLLRHRV